MVGMTCGGYFSRDCNLECISSLPGRDPLSIILSTTGDQHDLLVEHLLKMRAKVQVQYPKCTLLECVVCTTSHLARVRDVPKFYVYASCRIVWCKISNTKYIVVGWSTRDAQYTLSAWGAWDELDPRGVQCAVGQRVSSSRNLLRHAGELHHITHAHAHVYQPTHSMSYHALVPMGHHESPYA